jgi:Uma2 family endonuclease
MTQTLAKTVIGPTDHGRRMSLDEFDTAIGREGRLYELSRGVIVVSDVPNPPHAAVLFKTRRQLAAYDLLRPGEIHGIYGGSDCKLLIAGTESERHPDIAVYKTPAPRDDSSVWSVWVPAVVIEIVSEESAHRDYEEKPEDYLQFGVLEYWIIDPLKSTALIHQRMRGKWKLQPVTPGQKYSTAVLPQFELDIAASFAI